MFLKTVNLSIFFKYLLLTIEILKKINLFFWLYQKGIYSEGCHPWRGHNRFISNQVGFQKWQFYDVNQISRV